MSRPKLRIKRDDTVIVVAGKDKGKTGRVLRVFPEDAKVVVEGVKRVKRHQKPVGEQPGSIVEKEAPIHVSNVALWNPEQGRRVKVGYKVQEDGKKVRVDRATGTVIDNG
jgi:large subunit ribosomal protein L24